MANEKGKLVYVEDLGFEFAAAGTYDEKDVTIEMRDGREVRVLHKAKLTGFSLVPLDSSVRWMRLLGTKVK